MSLKTPTNPLDDPTADPFAIAAAAAAEIAERTGVERHDIALTLGSGWAKAAEVIFTGRTLSAKESLVLGLTNEVVPDAELRHRTTELARQIVANSWHTLRADKRLVDGGQNLGLIDGLQFERDNSPGRGPDMEQRLKAFAAFSTRRSTGWAPTTPPSAAAGVFAASRVARNCASDSRTKSICVSAAARAAEGLRSVMAE